MADNKTKPTDVPIATFLQTADERRRLEAEQLIAMMTKISGEKPTMWGPSIIGFGSRHYVYDSGRAGDMPRLSFSPRKSAITIYVAEGFDRYGDILDRLGPHKASVGCLYIAKLSDIDMSVLEQMLKRSNELDAEPQQAPSSPYDYARRVPIAAKSHFKQLREIVQSALPQAKEVLSYGVIGYKVDDKRARVFISGFKDHVGVYPIPQDEQLRMLLAPYIRGKGTLWFPLDQPLPRTLIERVATALART